MDTYGVEKTPVEGVWKLGRLDSVEKDLSLEGPGTADNRIKNLIKFLQLSNWQDNSWYNPQIRDLGLLNLNWHVDGHTPNNSSEPRKISAGGLGDMIVMVHGKEGTLFKVSNDIAWKSKPWTIYFINYDVIHASPLVKTPRFLSRIHLDSLRRGKLHPVID